MSAARRRSKASEEGGEMHKLWVAWAPEVDLNKAGGCHACMTLEFILSFILCMYLFYVLVKYQDYDRLA
jgi:hypothetical protein